MVFLSILGLVDMDMSGYSEKGIKRKIAVQTLFGKVYYLSEVSDFNKVATFLLLLHSLIFFVLLFFTLMT